MDSFKTWIVAAGIRALKTVAEAAVSIIGMSALITEVNWLVVASSASLAGILSLLTSIAGLPELEEKAKARSWIAAAGIRAIKTMAQTAVSLIGSTLLITEVNWISVASAVAMSGVMTLILAIAGLPEQKAKTDEGTEE